MILFLFSFFLSVEDPKEFMIDYITKLKASKAAKIDHPCIFDESNIRSFFGILDPAKKGYINHSQYKMGRTFHFFFF